MVKRALKLIVFFSFILSGAFLWVGRKSSPGLRWSEFDYRRSYFNSHPGVLIIFNSGGWGNTAFEEAEDFSKVTRGIKAVLNKLGWKTAIVSYGRTGDNFLSRIQSFKEILSSFKKQSEKLSKKVKTFLEYNPTSRVLITGLSLGADFAGETMERIGQNSRVFAVRAGTPFWASRRELKSILELTSEKDIMVTGNYKTLFSIILKGWLRWLAAKVKRHKLSLSKSTQVPGHHYDWRSPQFRNQIISFLEINFKQE